MEVKITIEDILKDAVKTLNNLSVPISQHETLGAELFRITKNIQSCVVAIEEQKNNKEDVVQEQEEPEPGLAEEPVPEESESI